MSHCGWQLIETAPKDEAVLVAFVEPRPLKRPRSSFVGEAEYRNGQWWWPNDYDGAIDPQPTHWMPLPDPPTAPATA